jgi:3-phenylpropionate/trans-cinnamate dioxygenase ferredoxin reductase subunit
MSPTAGVVIVGAGQAGYQTAESLRHEGYHGSVILIGDEPHIPYQRPPLSKDYLLGETDAERIRFRNRAYYDEHSIDLRLRTKVSAIDRGRREVELADGSTITYEHLVLATGARVRTLDVPGADLDGVFLLRTLDDVDRIDSALEAAEKVVVIGAGFIGLEFAAVARKLGRSVTVLEAAPRVMGRIVSPRLSGFFEQLHRGHGVELVCQAAVSSMTGRGGQIQSVECADDSSCEADLVVIGVGIIPNTELAEACGLPCSDGIVVDAYCRTADPNVYAAGDCAVYDHPFAGHPIRLESVQNAADQGRTVAASITGREKAYDTVPWFWSDQYDVKLQMVGLQTGCDETVARGDTTQAKFSLFHFRDGVLRAVDSVNRPADHVQSRKLLAARSSPTPAQAADPDFKLKELLT